MDMQKWVRDNIRQGMTPPEWDTILSKATQHFFPKLPPPPQADSADTVLARRMWRSKRMSAHNSTAEDPDTAALLLQHQKAVRQAKKTKADAFLAEVDAAINAGDQFVAFKVLKQLRPWQPSQKAQLKDSQGYLLSPTGELQALRKYATDVFGKYPRLQDNFVELSLLATTTLAKHIASIKPGKAVPKGAAPALLTCLRPLTLFRVRIYLTNCRPSPLSPAWSRWSMVSTTPQSIAFMRKAATRRWKRPQASNRDANSRPPCFLY